MSPVKRILVPVDFSDCSRAALGYAVELAERFGAAVDLLLVWGFDLGLGWAPFAPDGFQQERDLAHSESLYQLRETVAATAQRTFVPVSGRIEAGEPRDVVLEVAREDGYDLIVMGTNGRTGMSHPLLGSLAEQLVRRAPCPLLTVRSATPAPRGQEAADVW